MNSHSTTIARAGEKQGGRGTTLLPLLIPIIYPPLILLKYLLQEAVNTRLAARNDMQMEVAKRMFPANTEQQIACLCSEVCRKRTSKLLQEKPWLVSCYLAGLQDFVIGILTRGSCDRCRLKKQPPPQ